MIQDKCCCWSSSRKMFWAYRKSYYILGLPKNVSEYKAMCSTGRPSKPWVKFILLDTLGQQGLGWEHFSFTPSQTFWDTMKLQNVNSSNAYMTWKTFRIVKTFVFLEMSVRIFLKDFERFDFNGRRSGDCKSYLWRKFKIIFLQIRDTVVTGRCKVHLLMLMMPRFFLADPLLVASSASITSFAIVSSSSFFVLRLLRQHLSKAKKLFLCSAFFSVIVCVIFMTIFAALHFVHQETFSFTTDVQRPYA